MVRQKSRSFISGSTLTIWSSRSNAETFGSVPECSHRVNYMVFVIKVPALGAGKASALLHKSSIIANSVQIVGLTASSILTAAYVLITLHELRSYRRSRKECKEPSVSVSSPTYPKSMSSATSVSTDYPLPMIYHKSSPAQLSLHPQETASQVLHVPQKRRPRRRRWSYDIDPMLIGERPAVSFVSLFKFLRNHDMPNPRLYLFYRFE